MAAEQEAQELFERIAERYLEQPGVSRGTGFGSSAGLRVGGRIFAMLDRQGSWCSSCRRSRWTS